MITFSTIHLQMNGECHIWTAIFTSLWQVVISVFRLRLCPCDIDCSQVSETGQTLTSVCIMFLARNY